MSKRRHGKSNICESEDTGTSFSICGQEMILYPRKKLYEVMLRKKNQRVGKVCNYHYKASAMRRRIIATDVSHGHDVTRRAIRTVGRSSHRPVHREQSVEEVSFSPRPHFSVQVRSLLYHTTNMSTAAAAVAVTRATRESIQNTNASTRLHVSNGEKKNNLLFSGQCSENDSTDVLLETSTTSEQQQQCYLNSPYDYLFQRHVDTLNKVISENTGQNQILDKNIKQQNQKVNKSTEGNNINEHSVDFEQGVKQQSIRISVSSSEESATSQDVSSLASEERRSPPAASDCCLQNSKSCNNKGIETKLEALSIDPNKPRIVLSQQASSDSSQLLHSTTRRSRSPSPLLEVPVESVDISREIKRPPIQ